MVGAAYIGRFFFFFVVVSVGVSVGVALLFAIGSVEFIGIALGSAAGVAGVIAGSLAGGVAVVVSGVVVLGLGYVGEVPGAVGDVCGVVCARAAEAKPSMAMPVKVAIRMEKILSG